MRCGSVCGGQVDVLKLMATRIEPTAVLVLGSVAAAPWFWAVPSEADETIPTADSDADERPAERLDGCAPDALSGRADAAVAVKAGLPAFGPDAPRK
jgi:hypothetical protein